MKEKIIMAIDNGITGSMACIDDNGSYFYEIPIKKELSYTKKKQYISRIDVKRLWGIFSLFSKDNVKVYLERPMVNPTRWKASVSAIRALEATLVLIEEFDFSLEYMDSKEWQKKMLPSGLKTEELKKASLDVACRLFPKLKDKIIKHKDGDSLLMAEYVRRKKL